MIVSIHQPNFIPWAGYFHKIIHSDCFVMLDNVEFTKGGFTNRNRIKFSNGKPGWLTIPIKISKGSTQKINEIEVDTGSNWQEKHLRTFIANYTKAKYFSNYYEKIRNIYSSKYTTVKDLNVRLLEFVIKELDIKTAIVIASDIDMARKVKSNELLVEICKTLGAKKYLSGSGAKKYNDPELTDITINTLSILNYSYMLGEIEVLITTGNTDDQLKALQLISNYIVINFNVILSIVFVFYK